MKKFYLFLVVLLQFFPTISFGQSMVTNKQDGRKAFIMAASFPDYFPIASLVTSGNSPHLETVFDDAVDDLSQVGNFDIKYSFESDYDNIIMSVKQGKIDILLGMYYDTKKYKNIEYIYPAVLNNPVYLIVTPQNRSLISSSEDLKNFKGTYIAGEHFSDYMLNNFKVNNIVATDSAFEAYKKLLTGEVDYIIGSYYYNYVKVCELGLKNYVAFSQSALWNMPIFLGVSKASKYYKKISSILRKLAVDDKFTASINQSLVSTVKEAEVKYQGVVPPSFVKEQQGALTPADEMLQNTVLPKEE